MKSVSSIGRSVPVSQKSHAACHTRRRQSLSLIRLIHIQYAGVQLNAQAKGVFRKCGLKNLLNKHYKLNAKQHQSTILQGPLPSASLVSGNVSEKRRVQESSAISF